MRDLLGLIKACKTHDEDGLTAILRKLTRSELRSMLAYACVMLGEHIPDERMERYYWDLFQWDLKDRVEEAYE
jgi:hypothetical protein